MYYHTYFIKTGTSTKSTKNLRHSDSGARRIVTRIVRKTTTVTRGEENTDCEDSEKFHPKLIEKVFFETIQIITFDLDITVKLRILEVRRF